MKNLLARKKGGMDLGTFLLEYEKELRGMRCLYVLQANLETELIKFGIANNAYNRLKNYEIQYGTNENINDCQGVWLYFLGVVKYNDAVPIEKSQVGLIETKLKRHFRSVTEKKRGTERINAPLKEILKFIKCNAITDREFNKQRRADIKESSKVRREAVQRKRRERDKSKTDND